MKKIIIGIFLLVSVGVSARHKVPIKLLTVYNDTTVIVQIMALPLSTFIGKPVDSIFAALPTNYTGRGFVPVGIFNAKGVYQSYGTSADNCASVVIYVDNWQNVSFSPTIPPSSWSMNSAKLETVAFIRVFKNNACIYGCNNPNYYD